MIHTLRQNPQSDLHDRKSTTTPAIGDSALEEAMTCMADGVAAPRLIRRRRDGPGRARDTHGGRRRKRSGAPRQRGESAALESRPGAPDMCFCVSSCAIQRARRAPTLAGT